MSKGSLLAIPRFLFYLYTCAISAWPQIPKACSQQTLTNYCASVPSSVPPVCTDCAKIYRVQSYQGGVRCLDYTPEVSGSPVVINNCSEANTIVVEELSDGTRNVILHAGSKLIGARASTTAEMPLELQDLVSDSVVKSNDANSNQVFVLDGDSIILASNRTLVAKVQNARGAAGSPVVLGQRSLADNEFWHFVAIGNAPSDPTSGFVRVGYDGDPYCGNPASCTCRLFNVAVAANPGTVIKLGSSVDLTDCPPLEIRTGVTIRGDRRGTQTGPALTSCFVVDSVTKCDQATDSAAEIEPMVRLDDGANDARVTGLSLHGPSRSTDGNQTKSIGVDTGEQNLRNIIDHNDVFNWTTNGLRVHGADKTSDSTCDQSSTDDPRVRKTTAFISHNFIHHNMQQESGYGIESYLGAYPFILGNTFVSNRHAIAAGFGTTHTAYRAWDNLVLSAAPLQHGLFHTQDFDMHGTGSADWFLPSGFGGTGGSYIDIYQNTFFGTNRNNFELRGDPCHYAEFHNNVSLESAGDAVSWTTCNYYFCGWEPAGPPQELRVSSVPAQFNHSNPASGLLGVGDFDGDGTDDLFLATGTAWYYSAAGKTEWRYLSGKPDTLSLLLFGDFDGDGRTDVVALHNGKFVVSWGGISDWEILNNDPTGGRLLLLPDNTANMTVGHFGGPGSTDIFWTDGHTWWVSYGGTTIFQEIQTSGFAMADLRFGDFNNDGKTDIFTVGRDNWEVSYAPASGNGLFSSWQPLPKKLTNSARSLVVADFDGDGFADVATDCGSGCWEISSGGRSNWKKFSQPVSLSSDLAGIGHFNGTKATDVLTWNNYMYEYGSFFPVRVAKCDNSHGQVTQLCISAAAVGLATHYSTQDMR